MLQQIVNEIKTGGFLSPWLVGPAVSLLLVMILLSMKTSILALIRAFLGRHKTFAWAESLIEGLSPALTIAILGGRSRSARPHSSTLAQI
jgi:hypothetical protein